jgi:hypothetical protein
VTSLEEGVSGVRLAGVDVKGDILMQTDQDATDVTVGSVVWSARNATANEVDAYLRKHGAVRLCYMCCHTTRAFNLPLALVTLTPCAHSPVYAVSRCGVPSRMPSYPNLSFFPLPSRLSLTLRR